MYIASIAIHSTVDFDKVIAICLDPWNFTVRITFDNTISVYTVKASSKEEAERYYNDAIKEWKRSSSWIRKIFK